MIGYEEALEKALELKHGLVDHCLETTNTWIFSHSSEATNLGGPGPCVVVKETGVCLSYIGYMWDKAHEGDEDVKEFDIC